MNMVGKIRDKNETMDMDQLFSSGYIIELETGKYLSGYNKKSIRSSPLERAIRFRSKQQAAECISQHLCYAGLEAWICEILWVLLSYKYELEGLAEYWTGTVFSDQFQSAVTFTTYREAERYQKVHNLENTSMIELQCFRREQMVIAA